jgi:hypothetical protein
MIIINISIKNVDEMLEDKSIIKKRLQIGIESNLRN